MWKFAIIVDLWLLVHLSEKRITQKYRILHLLQVEWLLTTKKCFYNVYFALLTNLVNYHLPKLRSYQLHEFGSLRRPILVPHTDFPNSGTPIGEITHEISNLVIFDNTNAMQMNEVCTSLPCICEGISISKIMTQYTPYLRQKVELVMSLK